MIFPQQLVEWGKHKVTKEFVLQHFQKSVQHSLDSAFTCADVMFNAGHWYAIMKRLCIMAMERCGTQALLPIELNKFFKQGESAMRYEQRETKNHSRLVTKHLKECRTTMNAAISCAMQAKKSSYLLSAIAVSQRNLFSFLKTHITEGCSFHELPQALDVIPRFKDDDGQLVNGFLEALTITQYFIIKNNPVQLKILWHQILDYGQDKLSPLIFRTLSILKYWSKFDEDLAMAAALALIYPMSEHVDKNECVYDPNLHCFPAVSYDDIPEPIIDSREALEIDVNVDGDGDIDNVQDPWLKDAAAWYRKLQQHQIQHKRKMKMNKKSKTTKTSTNTDERKKKQELPFPKRAKISEFLGNMIEEIIDKPSPTVLQIKHLKSVSCFIPQVKTVSTVLPSTPTPTSSPFPIPTPIPTPTSDCLLIPQDAVIDSSSVLTQTPTLIPQPPSAFPIDDGGGKDNKINDGDDTTTLSHILLQSVFQSPKPLTFGTVSPFQPSSPLLFSQTFRGFPSSPLPSLQPPSPLLSFFPQPFSLPDHDDDSKCFDPLSFFSSDYQHNEPLTSSSDISALSEKTSSPPPNPQSFKRKIDQLDDVKAETTSSPSPSLLSCPSSPSPSPSLLSCPSSPSPSPSLLSCSPPPTKKLKITSTIPLITLDEKSIDHIMTGFIKRGPQYLRTLFYFPHVHQTTVFQQFFRNNRQKALQVWQNPFDLLENPIFSKVPRLPNRISMLGVWAGPGVLNQRKVFLKGPVTQHSAWIQYAVNCFKRVIDPDQIFLPSIRTEVVIFKSNHYILMESVCDDYDQQVCCWSTKPPHITCGVVTHADKRPMIRCIQFKEARAEVEPETKAEKKKETEPETKAEKKKETFCTFDKYLERNVDDFFASSDNLHSYLAILLFRGWMGITDTVHSNILFCPSVSTTHPQRLYSIDEMCVGKYNTNFLTRVSCAWTRKVVEHMTLEHAWCSQMILGWWNRVK